MHEQQSARQLVIAATTPITDDHAGALPQLIPEAFADDTAGWLGPDNLRKALGRSFDDRADHGRRFQVTLDSKLHVHTPRTLGLAGAIDLFVCRDTALDDAHVANLVLHCRLRTI